MKKKLLVGLAAASLFVATPAFAHPAIQVYVDGQTITFDQAPVIVDDRTLVPMRAIFQALGSTVAWSEPEQLITSTKGGDTVVLKIGEAGLFKNGQLVYTMDVPARIMNDRTMVPLRAIAQAFDAEVDWDGVGYVITINSKKAVTDTDYTTEVKATDGTVVLTYQMEFAKSGNAYADNMQTIMKEDAKTTAKAFVEAYGDKAKADYEKARNGGFAPYSFVGSYEITREDSKYVSFYGTSSQYTGGGSAVKSSSSHTFFAQNGKEAVLSDIVKDGNEELEDFLTTSFEALIDAKPTSFYSDAKKRLERALDEVDFYLTKDGIAFYLPAETIAPKDAGVVSFTLKFEL